MPDFQGKLAGGTIQPSHTFSRKEDNFNRSLLKDSKAMSMQTANCCSDRSEGRNDIKSQMQDGIHATLSPWKTSYPVQASRLDCRPYNLQDYYNLSPTSRHQVISQGQQQLMDMIQDMPEDSYELSLKDIVEKPIIQTKETEVKDTVQSEKIKNKKKYDKNLKLFRVQSMENGNFLLKMFLPSSLGLKKKNTDTGPSAKVRSSGVKVEKGLDKELWKKRFSITEENEKKNSSTGHISNRGSNNCRNTSDLLLCCWSFLYSNEHKITHQKGEDRKANEYSSSFTHKAMKTSGIHSTGFSWNHNMMHLQILSVNICVTTVVI